MQLPNGPLNKELGSDHKWRGEAHDESKMCASSQKSKKCEPDPVDQRWVECVHPCLDPSMSTHTMGCLLLGDLCAQSGKRSRRQAMSSQVQSKSPKRGEKILDFLKSILQTIALLPCDEKLFTVHVAWNCNDDGHMRRLQSDCVLGNVKYKLRTKNPARGWSWTSSATPVTSVPLAQSHVCGQKGEA